MGGILQVDTIQNNNATTLITQTNSTTLTFGVTGQNIVIPTGVTFNTASATVTLPSTINATTINVTTVVLAAGAVGTPSLTTSGDTNTGIFFPSADTIAFTEGGTEAMRIDSSGRLLVGTTVHSISSTQSGEIKSSGATGFAIVNTTAGNNPLSVYNEGTSGTRRLIQFLEGAAGGTVRGFISTDGSTVAYNTTSDYRLKENVNYNFDATTRLKQLKPARFNFITEPNKTVDGFLAHEVSNIIPEAITGTKDQVEAIGNITDSDNNIIQENITEPSELPENQTWTQTGTRPVHQGIDQSKLTPILTKALQEAIARIEQLEARLTVLENN